MISKLQLQFILQSDLPIHFDITMEQLIDLLVDYSDVLNPTNGVASSPELLNHYRMLVFDPPGYANELAFQCELNYKHITITWEQLTEGII